MKATIHDLVLTEREVDIPDACPKCGRDFHDAEDFPLSVEHFANVYDRARLRSVATALLSKAVAWDHIEYLDKNFFDDDASELLGTSCFCCASCGFVLARAEMQGTTVEPAPLEEDEVVDGGLHVVLAQGGRTEVSEGTVECKFCHRRVSAKTAHSHAGGFVGDDCCWDERLRTTE